MQENDVRDDMAIYLLLVVCVNIKNTKYNNASL